MDELGRHAAQCRPVRGPDHRILTGSDRPPLRVPPGRPVGGRRPGQLSQAAPHVNLGPVRVLRGTVATGIGDLARWMVRYADLYEECTGVRLYPGSLNVVLGEAYHLPLTRRCAFLLPRSVEGSV